MTLKKHLVSVKAFKDIEITNIGINIFRKNKLMMEIKKEVTASGFPPSYLSFIEENSKPFTLKTSNTSKNWNGTLEYSTDTKNWSEWDGAEISSSNDGKLHLRGTGNTAITGEENSWDKCFVLTDNKRIQCLGNVENLLDYETVEAGNHPVMAESCYYGMFNNCNSLTKAPELPATTLAGRCYYGMFNSCSSLTKAPELPATTLAESCYAYMFNNCKFLTKAPELPATTLADNCYEWMLSGCYSITKAPELPATELTNSCYANMFYYCTSLTEAPELPATTLAFGCYNRMFAYCTSLTQAPEKLPATTLNYLTGNCYADMFLDCTSLTGTIHCPASIANNEYRPDINARIPANTATVVYDL